MIEPRATYRIQFQPEFDLADGAELVEYLDRLGISHVYASPLARAVPGSTHGYDVVDPATVDPDRGGADGLAALHTALRSRGLGLVLDVVPNHQAAHEENPRWWSLLADGPGGEGAETFDVEWDAPGADGRVVLPLLGEPLDDAIRAGRVVMARRGGVPVVEAAGFVLPVRVTTTDLEAAAVRDVLEAQPYRLEYWRTGEPIVNYRRFFDVATLPAARVERPPVFDAQMALARALLADRVADGIRVDHVDGLRDPAGFLRRCRAIGAEWLLVEKILGPGEALPDDWDVDGTTGYDFAERIGSVLVDPRGEAPLTATWVEASGDDRPFTAYERDGRRLVLDRLFRADRARLARAVARALGSRPHLDESVTALLAAFTVYRTYVGPGERAGDDDRRRITDAAARAVRDGAEPHTTTDLARVLLGEVAGDAAEDARLRFQQLCAAVTAKGVEDTAGYRYARLVARNDVGGDPGRFAGTVDALHAANAAAPPRGLLALSTHDSKRSADVRARIAVLAEVPDAWRRFVHHQRARLAKAWAPVSPDAGIELLLLQTALGAWPLDAARLTAYAHKAAREAKDRTSWRDPDPDFEAALDRVCRALLTDPARAELERFAADLLVPGRINALSQVVAQCTTPGVPDVYWGDEIWNLRLVDPDNRHPPPDARRAVLDELLASDAPPSAATLSDPTDPGRPKLWTLHRCLALRRRRPECFGADADYAPVPVGGPGAAHAIAWARAGAVVAVVPRMPHSRPPDWGEATLVLPPGEWHDVVGGPMWTGGSVPLGELLARFPVSVLERV